MIYILLFVLLVAILIGVRYVVSVNLTVWDEYLLQDVERWGRHENGDSES